MKAGGLAAAFVVALGTTAFAESVTVVTSGGSYQEAMREATYIPVAQMTGIEIKEDAAKSFADVRLQVGEAVGLEQVAGRLPRLRGVVGLDADRQPGGVVDEHQRPEGVPVGVRAAGVHLVPGDRCLLYTSPSPRD